MQKDHGESSWLAVIEFEKKKKKKTKKSRRQEQRNRGERGRFCDDPV